jgi:LCP family protein required for cell wall assembly
MPRQNEIQHVRRPRRGLTLPPWLTVVLLVVFVGLVVGLSLLTFRAVKNIFAGAPLGTGDSDISPDFSPAEATAQAEAAVSGDTAILSEGRVTVLLMGIDEREAEYGPWRTDTMILMTVDPATQTAGMISIPRDLWVSIPDYETYDRINNAHFIGDRDHYPGGGGPALAMKTVEQALGVQVKYFATVNFAAFVTIIDHLGCIDIEVPETIDDPDYPAPSGSGYDPFYLEAGEYCLGGETLLKYARTRATFGGDFDRAKRQQQVIYAIRDHILSTGELPNLIARAPDIYEALADNVNTNLTEADIIDLARVASEIPEENICSAVISGEYIEQLQTLPDGSQVAIPDRVDIRQLVEDVYTGTGVCTPGYVDPAVGASAENATVNILNGTTTEGFATQTGDFLAAQGIKIAGLGNADNFDYATTVITVYTGKIYTAQRIAELLRVPQSAIVEVESENAAYDIEVILGRDYIPQQ